LGLYRRKLDIIAEILRLAEGEVKKTHIMHGANLSYVVLMKYLAELTAASLLAYQDDGHCYVLTDKGRDFLVVYSEYLTAKEHIQKRLTDIHNKKVF
jgi:predicted transcriptional regulator